MSNTRTYEIEKQERHSSPAVPAIIMAVVAWYLIPAVFGCILSIVEIFNK